MMNILSDIKLCEESVHDLLERFDTAFSPSLHEGIDFDLYSKKLSENAYFILTEQDSQLIGFVAYYKNLEGKFLYVPFTAVHPDGRHKHIGHKMFTQLKDHLNNQYLQIKLEVLKNNVYARSFYEREGFVISEDRNEKLLLKYTYHTKSN